MASGFIALLSSNAGLAVDSSNWSGSLAAVGRFCYFALITAIVIFLAYYCTKMIASARLSKSKREHSNLQVVDSISIGFQGSIQLVKAGDKYILLAVTKDKISFLTEVDAGNIELTEGEEALVAIPFEKYLRKFIQKDKTNE